MLLKMKKQCLTFVFMVAFCAIFNQNLHAQAFEKGKTFVSLGYGVVNFGTVYKNIITTAEPLDKARIEKYSQLPIALQAEYAATKHWGFGLSAYYERYDINHSSVGLFSEERFDIQDKFGLFSVIARANYHFGKKESRFDPYIGGGLGFTNLFLNIEDAEIDNAYILIGELKLGGRYFFSKNIAAHLELGMGTILLQTGLTAKF